MLSTMVVSSTGRRPTRSESRPSTAAAKNCMSEYTPSSAPNSKPWAPNRTA